jgi:hypothetical protein
VISGHGARLPWKKNCGIYAGIGRKHGLNKRGYLLRTKHLLKVKNPSYCIINFFWVAKQYFFHIYL